MNVNPDMIITLTLTLITLMEFNKTIVSTVLNTQTLKVNNQLNSDILTLFRNGVT